MTLLTILAVATLAAALGALIAALVGLDGSERDLRRTESRLEAMGDTLEEVRKHAMAASSYSGDVPLLIRGLAELRRRGMVIKEEELPEEDMQNAYKALLTALYAYYGGENKVDPCIWAMLDVVLGKYSVERDVVYAVLRTLLNAKGVSEGSFFYTVGGER
ncbi:MAG: hypothetical protein LUI09_03715 [Prevotellaceae bacterium]|nr:hypothetical protein [Prevotellaceae bacterium]